MPLPEIAKTLRTVWNELFHSRYIRHLEHEVEVLRSQNGLLQLKLETALTPKPAPEPVKRDFSKFVPVKTNWESYVEEQIKLQELEAEPTSPSVEIGN